MVRPAKLRASTNAVTPATPIHRRVVGGGCGGLGRCQPGASTSGRRNSTKSKAFPRTYDQALSQAAKASKDALADGVSLQEIEFPPLDLSSVCGDGEGSVEADANLKHVVDLTVLLTDNGRANQGLRLLLPDEDEMRRALAVKEAEHPRSPLDLRASFLTTPSIFGDIGLDPFKRPVADRVTPSEDALYLIGYPSYNVNEMLAVQELFGLGHGKPIVIINGELDRFRSAGYYPSLFYPKIAEMSRDFIPDFEAVFYIHNFKGRRPGALYRRYPGEWQVYRRDRDNEVVGKPIHTQKERPSLKEIALEFFA